MKRYLLIVLVTLFTLNAGFAQEDNDGQPGAKLQERMREYIQKRLNLNKAEAEKFNPVFMRYLTELRKVHRENKTDRPMQELRIAEVRVKYRNEFRQVLDEQRANRVFKHEREFLDKVIEVINERRMENRRGPGIRTRIINPQAI